LPHPVHVYCGVYILRASRLTRQRDVFLFDVLPAIFNGHTMFSVWPKSVCVYCMGLWSPLYSLCL